ncbi:dimethylarginine dimethylaminohydrolase family protein [soil metagenome]
MEQQWGGHSMVAPLKRVLVYPPAPASEAVSWQEFGYLRPMNHKQAVEEHAALRRLLSGEGVEVISGEIDNARLQDAIFPFDPVITTNAGAILSRMGKELREPEVDLAEQTMTELGIPIIGRIEAPGTVEGGDCLWIDELTLAAGETYRTNAEGIRQLGVLLKQQGVTVLRVGLPYWHGPAECLHLLSLISMVDEKLAVVYLPLLEVAFVEFLRERGVQLVEIPDNEFSTQGCNVLALSPGRCLLLKENPETARRLEAAGCEVLFYTGDEISHNRTGGPTCLTRPILRAV